MKVKKGDAHEFETHQFIVEASTIGVPPGRWPELIPTELGNGQPFYLLYRDCGDGADSATYQQLAGCIFLKVFND